ncbi:hypothetical protein WAZ07_01050 [Bacillus sp. FJAT-51639]|uniref:Uncharacterized protein n=1 Tax=Bacillus bruguierae TaxID=3127667 RepID=A0ABU8FBP1_9BACI
MLSISIFDKTSGEANEELRTNHREEVRTINDFEERLETYIIQNETSPTGYTNYRIITDAVYNQRVRVKGEYVDQVIRQELHEAYFQPNRARDIGHLITLCRKEDAEKVKNIFEELYGFTFVRHPFNILEIINASTDVRSARFDVQIETVNGVTMRGTAVHNTQYYTNMLNSGELKAVIVTFDMPYQAVTFRISVDGSILLYNNLDDYQILELVEELLRL